MSATSSVSSGYGSMIHVVEGEPASEFVNLFDKRRALCGFVPKWGWSQPTHPRSAQTCPRCQKKQVQHA
jgi:hypothetical protein